MNLPADFTGLMVATPCYGGTATVGFFNSVLRLALGCKDKQLVCEVVMSPGDSLVTRARNTLAAVFMASRHSHLLFIDADIEFQPKDVLRLLAADKDLICGIYPKKSINLEFPLNWLPGSTERLNVDPASGAIEILEGPTGFMLISRRCFEAMKQAWPNLSYRGPTFMTPEQQAENLAYFDCVIENGAYLSEDFAFCRRWRQLGGQVWALPDVDLRHHGPHGFTGKLSQWLSDKPLEASC